MGSRRCHANLAKKTWAQIGFTTEAVRHSVGRGERITRLDQLKAGDLLIAVSHQFRAENLVRVVVSPIPIPDLFYCEYVTPDTLRRSDHEEMAVWDHDLATLDRNEFFRAVPMCRAIIV